MSRSRDSGSLSVAFASDRQASAFALRLFALVVLVVAASLILLPRTFYQPAADVVLLGP